MLLEQSANVSWIKMDRLRHGIESGQLIRVHSIKSLHRQSLSGTGVARAFRRPRLQLTLAAITSHTARRARGGAETLSSLREEVHRKDESSIQAREPGRILEAILGWDIVG